VLAALEASHRTFAKTMPRTPHWYALRKTWTAKVPFEAVVRFIRDHGTVWERELCLPRPRRLDALDDGGAVASHNLDQQGEDPAVLQPITIDARHLGRSTCL
jgi:hypothetical protein